MLLHLGKEGTATAAGRRQRQQQQGDNGGYRGTSIDAGTAEETQTEETQTDK